MKKPYVVLGLLVAVLALAAGLGPLYTSRIADRQITATVDALNRQGVFEAHYSRIAYNWFGQQGTLKLIPNDPRMNSQLQRNGVREIVLRLAIAYGPIPFAAWQRDGVSLMPVGAVIDTRIDGLEQALRKAGSGYRLRDVVALNGDNALRLRLDPGSVTSAKGEHVQWTASELRLNQSGQRLSGSGHSSELTITHDAPRTSRVHISPLKLVIDDMQVVNGQSAGKYSISWDGMQANGPQRKRGTTLALEVGKTQFKVDTHFTQGIAAGKADMRMAGFSVREPADASAPLFSMKDMTISSMATEPQNDYTDSSLRWNVTDIIAQGQHYSPATVELHMNHLYVPAVRGTAKALQDLRRNMRAQGNMPPQFVFQRIAGVLMAPLQQLIEHQPVLQLSQLHLGTPNGALQGKGEARIEPTNGATPSLTTLPQDLVAQFTLDVPGQFAHKFATLAMARQGVPADQLTATSQRYLDRLQSQGFLRRQGDNYSLKLDYRNSTLLLNGRPVWQG